MKQYTVAACFTSFVLPLVLFVPELEERRKAVLTGCLAWNISIFPVPAQGEQHIHNVWQMIEADNTGPAPPGLVQSYKNDLWMLAEQKRDLFPWLMVNIPKAELRSNGAREMLSVRASNSDVDRTVAATSYCVQRANLIVYHRMLTAWQGVQSDPRIKSEIGHWLEVLNEIDANSKAVLDSLA